MAKIEISAGTPDFHLGGSYEWEKFKPSVNPIMDIRGDGQGWAKITEGGVRINAVPERTTIRVSGPGGWYIKGPEQIG